MSGHEDTALSPHARLELEQSAKMWRIVANSRWQDVPYWRERDEHARAAAAEARWREAEDHAVALDRRVLRLSPWTKVR